MGCIVELLYVKSIALKFNDGSFVVIYVTVIWSTKNSYYNWELHWTIPLVHLVAIKLSLMGPQDRQ